MKLNTTKIFEKKARSIHGNKYGYSKVVYAGAHCKVIIICPIHGEFSQRPTNHIDQGNGCPSCGGSLKKTTQQFTDQAKNIHHDKYDYSLSIYVSAFTKITIVCPIHGPFEQTPDNHLHGQGCPGCSIERLRQAKLKSKEQFLIDAHRVHEDSYIYSLVDYIYGKTKIKIICPIHGVFAQAPTSHLQGKGCPECGGTKKLTKESFVNKANVIHDGLYDYPKTDYENNSTKVEIECSKHGTFTQTPANHLSGKGCPKCIGRHKTSEDFKQEAKAVHGDRYLYSEVFYTFKKSPVKIICKLHGPFYQEPVVHLQGSGCPRCIGRNKTTEDLRQQLINIHGEFYDFSKSQYTGYSSDITVICPLHGENKRNTTLLLQRGSPCRQCTPGGFRDELPAILYYISVAHSQKDIFKIGITNHTVADRFKSQDFDLLTIVDCIKFDIGSDAREFERMILKANKKHQYKGPNILKNGNTELFNCDVIGVDGLQAHIDKLVGSGNHKTTR